MTGLRPFEGIIPLAQSFGAFSAAADVLSIGLGLHLPSGQLQLATRHSPSAGKAIILLHASCS